MVDRRDLHNFLNEDFEQFLPDDILGGTVHTEELVRDYIEFHLTLEKSTTCSSRYQPSRSRTKG